MEHAAVNPIALFVYGVLVYLGIGSAVAIWALFGRAERLDHRLASAPIRVRLVLVPGSALFWPLVVVRARKGSA
jgi:hypothetical protein